MGRKMVMVAGLLTNSVTMDTRMHASRVTAQGGRLLRDNIWCPIHVERPELCRPTRGHSEKKAGKALSHWDYRRFLEVKDGGLGGTSKSCLICFPISRQTGPSSILDCCDQIIFLAQKILLL